MGITSNHIDSGIKTAGKQTTNSNGFVSNGAQNGLDRCSPTTDIGKQKNFTPNAKKNNNKKARHR